MDEQQRVSRDFDKLEGFLDAVEDGFVYGWALNPSSPLERVQVEVLVDGEPVVSGTAESYRADLHRQEKGDGYCAFRFELPHEVLDGAARTLRVVYRATGEDLFGSPRSLQLGTCSATQKLSELSGNVGYKSPFGGLWTDLWNAEDLIAGKRALGWISVEESALLSAWVRDGFVIIPNAISHEVIDALDREVEQIWAGSSSYRCLVEYWENGVRTERVAGADFKERAVKLLDLHGVSDVARQIIFSKAIERFLNLLFERPALATQTLYFRWGSRQEMHQDSAFVKISSPMELVASWVALEDISPDSGELEFYVGSHRLEDYLFEGRSKWMPVGSSEYRAYVDSLHSRCTHRGLARDRFLAKKGDVLLWSADLVHGGSSYVSKGVTRKSLVSHYCPISCSPIYGIGLAETARHRFSDSAHYTYALRG